RVQPRGGHHRHRRRAYDRRHASRHRARHEQRKRRGLCARQGASRRLPRQLSAGRHGIGRIARPDARGDRAVAEPHFNGPHHTARDSGGGAQPPDADQGVRQIGAPKAADPVADRQRMSRLLIALLAAPLLALAQYPAKPVHMIIPFAPGGASDFVGRIMQPKLAELLGQTIVVENKPGAAGSIGAEVAAKSAPDGYTIFLGNVGSISINPGVYPKLGINPVKDFIAVTQVVDVPSILIIHPSVPANSVKELVAYAKANQGKLNFASPGSGSLDRLEMELFRKLEKP